LVRESAKVVDEEILVGPRLVMKWQASVFGASTKKP